MPQTTNYVFYSRLVLALAMSQATLVALAIWSTVEFIDEENELGNENTARDVGLYALSGLGGIVAVSMILCACAVNHEQLQQVFSLVAMVFSIVFLVVSSFSVNEENSPVRKRFLALGFLIGINLFFAAIASFRLSKTKEFDVGAEKAKDKSKNKE